MSANNLITRVPRHIIKTVTFDGTSGAGLADTAVPLATVSGLVVFPYLGLYCSTSLTESGATATLSFGTASRPAAYTAINATDLAAGDWMQSNSHLAAITTSSAYTMTAESLILMPSVTNVTAGVITLYAFWLPFSADGLAS